MKCGKFLLIMVMVTAMLSMVGCSEDDSSEDVVRTTTSAKISTDSETAVTTTFKMKLEEETTIETDDEEIIYDYDSAFSAEVKLEGEEETEDVKSPRIFETIKCEISFDRTKGYSEGLCAYMDERTGLWGYFDTNFNVVIRPAFADAYGFSEGLAAVNDGQAWGFIDTTGEYVIYPQFDDVEDMFGTSGFKDGYAIVTSIGNGYFIIDKTGTVVNTVDTQYLYHRGSFLFDGSGNLCDAAGNAIQSEHKGHSWNYDFDDEKYFSMSDYYTITECSKGDCRQSNVGPDESKLHIIDKKGNAVITYEDFGYNELDHYGDGEDELIASILTNNSFTMTRQINNNRNTALYDYNGNEIIPYYYTTIYPVCVDGEPQYYIGYFNNGECELMDIDGNVIEKEWFDTSVPVMMRYCTMAGTAEGQYILVYTQDDFKLVNAETDKLVFEQNIDTYMPILSLSCSNKKDPYEICNAVIYNNYLIIEGAEYYTHMQRVFDMNGTMRSEYISDPSHSDGVCSSGLIYGIIHTGKSNKYAEDYVPESFIKIK